MKEAGSGCGSCAARVADPTPAPANLRTIRARAKRADGNGLCDGPPMEHSWTLRDARNRFGAVVEAARRGEPQLVTKRGTPAVVVLAVKEYA